MSFTLCEQLELLKLRRTSLALVMEIKAYMKAQMQHTDIAGALSAIYQAMQNSDSLLKQMANHHRLIFNTQMQKIGARELSSSEPYLVGVLAQARLEYLQRLEILFNQLEDALHRKSMDARAPIFPQVEAALAKEKSHLEMRLSQNLDEARQRSNGVRQYRWVTMRDGKVRASHAALDGQTFDWDSDGLKPGEEYGCRCMAEPAVINDPPIEAVYPELALIVLLRLERAAVAIIRGAGKVVDKVNKKPAEKPTSKPLANSPMLNNTKTWPKPPARGKLKEGDPSRTKPTSRGEKSLYDEQGGEWRYSPSDKYHNEHWDYKPPGKNQGWKNIQIGDKPAVK